MTVQYVKQNDTSRAVQDTLTLNGAPINLTGATVTFKMRLVSGGMALVKTAAVVGDPTLGVVQYSFVGTDLANPGSYYVEWLITFADGHLLTVPDDSYAQINVIAQVG